MEKKSNRGGARPGAGRPAIYSKRVQIRLTPQELLEAHKKAEELNIALTKIFPFP